MDKYGIFTLLEVKSSKDARTRREVLLQILDYGSAITRMGLEEVCNKICENNDLFKKIATKQKSEAISRYSVEHFYDDKKDKNCKAFAEAMRWNLEKGYVRLCIAAESIPQPLIDLAVFVTTGPPNFALGIFELSIVRLGEKAYFVPHLKFATRRFPYDANAVASIITPPRTPLTMDEFYKLLKKEMGTDLTEATRKFIATIKEKTKNFFSPVFKESSVAIQFSHGSNKHSTLLIYANGRVAAGAIEHEKIPSKFKDAYIQFLKDSADLLGEVVKPSKGLPYWSGASIDRLLNNAERIVDLLNKFHKSIIE